MKRQELKLDLLRQEFPDYFELGKAYLMPKVPEGDWYESSWHNDVAPSWELETDERLIIRLWVDYPKVEDREGRQEERYSISLYTSEHDFICDVSSTEYMSDLYKDLYHLVAVLNEP